MNDTITEEYFVDIVKELFSEYLPKVTAVDRNDFIAALMEELRANGVDFIEPTDDMSNMYDD